MMTKILQTVLPQPTFNWFESVQSLIQLGFSFHETENGHWYYIEPCGAKSEKCLTIENALVLATSEKSKLLN